MTTVSVAKPRRELRMVQCAVLGVLMLYAFAPLVIFVLNAVKSPLEIASNPLGLPQEWNWSNFTHAWEQARIGPALLNSVMIAFGTAVGVALVASMAAYAMTRLNLPAKSGWTLWLLVSSTLPVQLFLIPLVSWWSFLGLYNERIGLVIIYVAVFSPFATLLLRSFLIGLPGEYLEAARLDGAGEFRVFGQIVVPMIWPGVLTAALIAGLLAYNEFLLAVTFIQDRDFQPVALSLYSFQQGYTTDYSMVSAAGVIMALPIVILFVFAQKKFIEGFASGGIAN